MKKTVKEIRSENIARGTWSGGTTAEYLSYPEGSTFEKRDFLFSICSATVDLEKSIFTDYTGYDRVILSLTEPYRLVHGDSEEYRLRPYQPHAFAGEMKTISYGKYTDLNLVMDRKKCTGEMYTIQLMPQGEFYGSAGSGNDSLIMTAILCAEGGCTLFFGETEYILKPRDMVAAERKLLKEAFFCKNNGTDPCRLVVCETRTK